YLSAGICTPEGLWQEPRHFVLFCLRPSVDLTTPNSTYLFDFTPPFPCILLFEIQHLTKTYLLVESESLDFFRPISVSDFVTISLYDSFVCLLLVTCHCRDFSSTWSSNL
ncbi:hypothetical protein TGAM01_v209625, partial [Trichoderma gamsii]